jgi:hypothetical protein
VISLDSHPDQVICPLNLSKVWSPGPAPARVPRSARPGPESGAGSRGHQRSIYKIGKGWTGTPAPERGSGAGGGQHAGAGGSLGPVWLAGLVGHWDCGVAEGGGAGWG